MAGPFPAAAKLFNGSFRNLPDAGQQRLDEGAKIRYTDSRPFDLVGNGGV